LQAVCAASEKKAAQAPSTTLILGFSAGALIGFGALLMSCVGGASPALAASNPGGVVGGCHSRVAVGYWNRTGCHRLDVFWLALPGVRLVTWTMPGTGCHQSDVF
jgi:hypothetical protein